VENPEGVSSGAKSLTLDGVDVHDGVVPVTENSGVHNILLVLGR